MGGARTLAFATQFRLGLSPDDQYVAMSVVQQLEMCLIMYFGDSLPEPGAPWDMQRRYREVELRLGRLRWIERRVADSQRGFRGVWNWVLGRRRLSGKELFDEMVRLADAENGGDPIDARYVQLMLNEDFERLGGEYLRDQFLDSPA